MCVCYKYYLMRKGDRAPFLGVFLSLGGIWTPEEKQIVGERTLGKDVFRSRRSVVIMYKMSLFDV